MITIQRLMNRDPIGNNHMLINRSPKMKIVILRVLVTLSTLLSISACVDFSIKELLGKDENYVVEKYGQPKANFVFNFNRTSNLYEYQSNLYKIFPEIADEGIEVKELQWKLSGNTVAVWLVKNDKSWVIVDALMWGEDIRY